MRKYFLLSFIVYLCITQLQAQNNNLKYWSDGPLQWDDFKGKYFFPDMDAELQYGLTFSSNRQIINDTVLLRLTAVGYIDRDLSWVRPEKRYAAMLDYNQVIFDIIELHRRKLQVKLDQLPGAYMADIEIRSMLAQCNKVVQLLRYESEQGTDHKVVMEWQLKIAEELSAYAQGGIPAFTKSPFSYGMHLGFGSGFSTGTLGEHLGSTFNFNFGFDFGYNDFTLFLTATLAGGRSKADYFGELEFLNNQRVNTAIGEAGLGYVILNTPRFRVTPYAGIGFLEYSKPTVRGSKIYESMINTSFIFGLNSDFKFRKTLSLIPSPMFQAKEYVEYVIRARLYVAQANFSPDMKGYSINLTLGFGGTGNFARIKK